MNDVPVKVDEAKPQVEPADPGKADTGKEDTDGDEALIPLTGAEAADTWAKIVAGSAMLVGLLWCLFGAGLGEISHNPPFQSSVDFALFAAFIVIAGALERFLEPLMLVLPPYAKKEVAKKEEGDSETETPEQRKAREKADRVLIAFGIAVLTGIFLSSLFGLYFLETMGIKLGAMEGSGESAKWVFDSTGDKLLRGLDVFITALIITGGTKPLHDMITSIEKKKEAVSNAAAGVV